MGVPGNANALLLKQAAAAAGGYEISRSVRLNAPDSAFLRATGRRLGWVGKRSGFGGNRALFGTDYGANCALYFEAITHSFLKTIQVAFRRGFKLVFRDPSAWYHIIVAVDTTQAIAANRAKIYVNGSEVTAFSIATYPSQNTDLLINNNQYHEISTSSSTYAFNGYLADIHFIDGQALDPTSFGEFDTNGVWQPIEYTGSFGTNGFHLPFSDNSTAAALGTDTSSNGNTWTVNNISIITGGPTSVAAASGALPVYNTTDTYGTVKGTGTRTDSNSSSIVLALPMDGANNGTTFTDESATIKGSGSAKTITRNGDTKTVTTQSKFYGSSGYFDGSGDYLTAGTSSDYIFGTGDFTVECWAYFNVLNTDNALITNHNNDSNWVFKVVSGKFLFYPGDGNGSSIIGTSTISTGSWYHFTATRQSGTLKLFVNGVLETTAALSPNYSLNNTLHIGAQQNNLAGTYLNGYLQDARLYKGVAKYTSNFSPPSSTQNPAIAAGNDSLVDSPTNGSQTDTGVGGEVVGNYCTFNPLGGKAAVTLANGNLERTGGNNNKMGTFGMSSGKWYWEIVCNTLTGGAYNGITEYSNEPDAYDLNYMYSATGAKFIGTATSAYGASYAVGDVVGYAYDADAGSLTCYKNGVSQGVLVSGLAGKTLFPVTRTDTSAQMVCNFGQRPFAYTAPSGFKALCTTNLPEPTIADGSTVMDVALYTGNGSTQTISGLNFSPDFVWIKRRDSAAQHVLYDQIRGAGANKELVSSGTFEEGNTSSVATQEYGYMSAFTSDGFSVAAGTVNGTYTNLNASTYAAWTWDAGSSTVTNTAGSITSQVRANASAGFSVVTYTGTGAAATVGHGLGVAPALVILKFRGTTSNWSVYHSSVGNTKRLILNSTASEATGSTFWNNTSPTSTVFSVGGDLNDSTTIVAYCFAPVAGYSSFGSYTGNGSADGPFVYTGMRPRWILIKNTSATGYWILKDTARDPANTMAYHLAPNASDADYYDLSLLALDSLSNGFKVRNSNSGHNTNGNVYLFIAFAESPFQYARAR
jgi:hypothetical protein